MEDVLRATKATMLPETDQIVDGVQVNQGGRLFSTQPPNSTLNLQN